MPTYRDEKTGKYFASFYFTDYSITVWYFKQSELSIPPKELHAWSQVHMQLAAITHDFSLFYDRKSQKHGQAKTENGGSKMQSERYESENSSQNE